jgi:hypothetical protein
MAARPLAALLLSLALLAARPARACKVGSPQPHLSDETRKATDGQAPRFTSPPTLTVTRGKTPDTGLGCEERSGSGDCSDLGTIRIAVPVSDDQTPAEACGFRLTLVRGTLPAGVQFPTTDVRAINGEIFLHWFQDDGSGPLDFVLAVSPIDAAANEGARVELPFSSGDGGCSVGGARPGTWLLVLLLAWWFGLRRLSPCVAAASATRRRRARSG